MTPLQTGDAVKITYEGRTVDGFVIMASPNGRSLLVKFEAMLGGYVGMMPILDGRDVFNDKPVTLARHT